MEGLEICRWGGGGISARWSWYFGEGNTRPNLTGKFYLLVCIDISDVMRQHYRYRLRFVRVAWTTTPQQHLHERLMRKTMEQ